MIKHVLNKEQAEELFKKEAVMIGNQDVIPEVRAIRYFGKEAVKFSHGEGCRNIYELGENGISLRYLYKKGFDKAVTYHNIMTLQDEVNEIQKCKP